MPAAVYKALIVGLSLLVLLLAYQTPLLSNKTLFSTNISRNMAAAQKSRPVVKKVYAVETPEVCTLAYTEDRELTRDLKGEGALVRRSIGSMSLRNLSPFLMLDHFHITPGAVSTCHNIVGSSAVDRAVDL